MTFDGLLSKTGRKLRIDYYQSTLNWAIEIDGLQHVSINDQIHDKSKRERKFAEQQARDATIKTYFNTKPEITLIRIPCYCETNSDHFKPLTIQQQYDAAVQICQRIHFALHGTRAPEPDKNRILLQTRNHTTNSESLLNRLNQQYNGKIRATEYRFEDDKPRIILKCKQGHITQVCLAKAYNDVKNINKRPNSTKPLCWACVRQSQFDQAKQRLHESGMIWINEQELRSQFHGTLSHPLTNKGSVKRIMLLCTHENDERIFKEIVLNQLLP
ncbi:hypothetical protein [Vibrio breoganii]|uniref:hypothetical protein n=1 Tax=Vibrio breoganii TaxID=553239 RepID=UPI000C85CD78|nr:hypothetical protein [Vibrio breoganii]PML85196.1 hypothetical protein BCT68_07630 [Vibrio breoganii]